MKLHEYQAKSLLARYGVPLTAGIAAQTPEEAARAAQQLQTDLFVVKAQIHAGGRGKGRFVEEVDADEIAKAARGEDAAGKGGVRLAKTVDDVRTHAAAMLGRTLVTKQTGPEGKVVRTVYVAAGCDIAKEFYLSILLDRANSKVLFMGSAEGGVDIEETAEHHPEKIFKVHVDSAVGLTDFQARHITKALGITDGKQVRSATAALKALYTAYMDLDCAVLEINPLVLTTQGELVALDCKFEAEGNALYRHPDVQAMRDVTEEEAVEIEASEHGLSFVKLDGNIGCLVNGAGLAMATMDIIQFKGAEPANFLDVGGGATQEAVTAAFRIITKDPNVEGILVNIFGGIAKCDVIAKGVLGAIEQVGLKVPLVCRLSGTNAELGRRILNESGLRVIAAENLDEAAEAIVRAVTQEARGSAGREA